MNDIYIQDLVTRILRVQDLTVDLVYILKNKGNGPETKICLEEIIRQSIELRKTLCK